MKLAEGHRRIEDRVPDARQIDEARHGGKRICFVSKSAFQKVAKPSWPTQSGFGSPHGAVATACGRRPSRYPLCRVVQARKLLVTIECSPLVSAASAAVYTKNKPIGRRRLPVQHRRLVRRNRFDSKCGSQQLNCRLSFEKLSVAFCSDPPLLCLERMSRIIIPPLINFDRLSGQGQAELENASS